MRIKFDGSALKATTWQQLLVRFLFGGLITAAAGIIAKTCGPAVGGLFLAFPAIFPASATLIEKHERERKQKAGVRGEVRARKAVSIDAAGAAIGSLGLLVFALIVYKFLDRHPPVLIVIVATLSWMLTSVALWYIRKEL